MRVNRKQGKSFFIAFCAVLAAACSSKKTTPASSIANEFSSLPEVTGPVDNVAPSSLSKISFRKPGSLAATSGVLLSSPGSFVSGNSLQMCENVNYLKEILREAASPDKILCYMAAMRSAGVIPSSVDMADGNVKYIKLINLPDSGGTNTQPVVKTRIVKAADGSISSFTMQSCFSGSTASPEQSEYISQTFSGTDATVVSKNKGSQTDGGTTYTYGSSMTATGDFSSGWTSKNVAGYRYFNSSAGDTNVMTLDMDQYSDRVDTSIAMKGTYGGNTFTNKFFSVMQLLGSDRLATLAVGDGSSKYSMSYDNASNGAGTDFSSASTVSWNGDTKANLGTASDGDYYTLANSGTVPSDPNTGLTITFSGDEAWDCTVPAGETLIEADFDDGGSAITSGMAACEDKYLGNSSWLQCPY